MQSIAGMTEIDLDLLCQGMHLMQQVGRYISILALPVRNDNI